MAHISSGFTSTCVWVRPQWQQRLEFQGHITAACVMSSRPPASLSLPVWPQRPLIWASSRCLAQGHISQHLPAVNPPAANVIQCFQSYRCRDRGNASPLLCLTLCHLGCKAESRREHPPGKPLFLQGLR